MKSIALAIPDFRGGGAERVIVLLANRFSYDGYKVTLIVRSAIGPRFEELCETITVVELKSQSLVTQAMEVRKICRDKGIYAIVGTLAMAHVVALSKLFGNKSLVVARLGNTLSLDIARHNKLLRVVHYIYQYCLLFSDKVVFQSQYMKKDFLTSLHLNDAGSFSVIYNPIEVDIVNSQINSANDEILDISKNDIICVGRLEYQKNYRLTLDLFSKYYSSNHLAKLHILGDGYQKDDLMSYTERLGIKDRVHFHGYQSNPYKYLVRAGVYLLTSHYEGFSNSLLEAAYLKLPCVVTDVPGGNREIISHGVNGYVFEPENMSTGFECIRNAFMLERDKNYNYEMFYIENIAREYYRLMQC
ncbi:TPA: glycosyltransferase [Vibrio parahaemolyticus]